MPVNYSTKQARKDAARRTIKRKELLADWLGIRAAVSDEHIKDVRRIPQTVWDAARDADAEDEAVE